MQEQEQALVRALRPEPAQQRELRLAWEQVSSLALAPRLEQEAAQQALPTLPVRQPERAPLRGQM